MTRVFKCYLLREKEGTQGRESITSVWSGFNFFLAEFSPCTNQVNENRQGLMKSIWSLWFWLDYFSFLSSPCQDKALPCDLYDFKS